MDGKHHVTRNSDTVSSQVPVGTLIVDDYKSWLIGWRRVCIRICCIHFETDIALVDTQSKEQTHTRLFNAARLHVSQLELRGCPRGAIASISRLAGAIALESVVPVLMEDNGISWGKNRGTIHFLLCHRIELLELGVLSLFPIGNASTLSSGETPKALFLQSLMRCSV